MTENSGFSSIAELMAASEQAAVAKARNEAAKMKARAMAPQPETPRTAAAPAAARSASNEMMDDFDYAIQAVEMARKSLPGNTAGVPKAAATILLAKRQISNAEATDLVDRAIRCLSR
jgi:hypothetical protein